MKRIYSLNEFSAIVRDIAKGRYFTVGVEYNEPGPGKGTNKFSCYIHEKGLNSGATMEEAISKLREAVNPSAAPQIDVELDNEPDDLKILHEKEPLLD